MLGGYQVEHLHLIAMAAEQLRCVGVKLALTVGDDGGFPPLYNAEQRRADQPRDLPVPDAPNTAMCRLSRVSTGRHTAFPFRLPNRIPSG